MDQLVVVQVHQDHFPTSIPQIPEDTFTSLFVLLALCNHPSLPRNQIAALPSEQPFFITHFGI